MTRSPQDGVRQGHLSVWLVVLVGLAAALASTLPAGGAVSADPSSGLIAFTRDGIYVMRADGTGVRVLRRGSVAAGAHSLDWSPDGRKLAFLADFSIWVMDADGSDAVRLTARSKKSSDDWFTAWSSPTWSPDGRRIAYTYGVGGEKRDVWVMNADGTSKHRLARTPDCSEVDVDWSPKGDQLVTTCVWGWGTRYLRLMKADGSAGSSLLAHGRAYEPDWSPDGRRIAFARFVQRGDEMGIYLVSAAGGSPVRLSRDGKKRFDREPTWSPDGRRIAFGGVSLGTGGSEQQPAGIYVMTADGKSVTRLTRNLDRSPAWQPLGAP